MKQLYYNPDEIPARIMIHSSCFNLDLEYSPEDLNDMPVRFDELFILANSSAFDEIKVFLTSSNDAYIKDCKKAAIGKSITGWVSLKDYGNGGGYLTDKYCIEILHT